ncbi:UDP-N-acetylmuramoyl-L-alanine--D-glutamate ligase [Simplicispira psychrophila]|uniref:UDP-N-acetylmuramoyl-L-alanine--D-glutamate ligase n=1 Tax=Simplicispira psychrophila TaxID=80882 RepID=UPI0004844451|nr:UDP-N-acetylmuramoyl-L-alanine--D-glutamate ligase [Simplicispira psychrophila]
MNSDALNPHDSPAAVSAGVPAPKPDWLLDGHAPAVSAAQVATEFVAQMFADVSTPATALAAVAAAAEAEAVSADTTFEWSSHVPAAMSAEQDLVPLQGRKVLVLGLGDSGLAMARWCVRCCAQVTVADTRAAPPQLVALQAEWPQVQFVAGAFDAALVDGQDLHAIYRSPGLSPASIDAVLIAASASGVSVGGELSLYSMALRTLRATQGYAPAVLAITGTNGKTTVTSLTCQLVERAGQSVAMAGNIGPTLLDTLTAHLDAGTLPAVWVLELSSFQLDGVTGFEPTAAAVLNLTQDHLDWHGSLEAYAGAKARIFGSAALMVLNREDPGVMAMLPEPVRVKLQKPQWRAYTTFGADLPQRPGDFGIETLNGMAWLVRAQPADGTPQRRTRGLDAEVEPLHLQRLMPADALRIRGRHNATNALAALALAHAAGGALGPMLYGLREYHGEPHRVQSIGRLNGIEYFDDSKGTNVGATVAALAGLGAERRVVVILGGDGKGQDFSPLALPVARYARAVLLIGRDAPLIRHALEDAGVPLLAAIDMAHAVQVAAQRAHPGDAVLLSPACASFDMFNGYEHRAQVFGAAVQALAQDVGQSLEGAP